MITTINEFRKILESKDIIQGGCSDNLSLEDIALKHKVSILDIKSEYNKGIKIEMEHTINKEIAKEIAKDHLFELPNYYTELEKMEKSAQN